MPDDLHEGDRLHAEGPGVPALSGTVEDVQVTGATHTYFLLLEEPAPGMGFLSAEGSGDVVAISLYLHLFGDAGAGVRDEWTPLLAEEFPEADVVP